jgi:hypothetical protein
MYEWINRADLSVDYTFLGGPDSKGNYTEKDLSAPRCGELQHDEFSLWEHAST